MGNREYRLHLHCLYYIARGLISISTSSSITNMNSSVDANDVMAFNNLALMASSNLQSTSRTVQHYAFNDAVTRDTNISLHVCIYLMHVGACV